MLKILQTALSLVALSCLAGCSKPSAIPETPPPQPPAHWFQGHSAAADGRVIAVPEGGSLSQALEQAAPGDTLQLAPGVYRETVLITKGGAEGAPITVRGSLSAKGEKLTRITTGTPLDAAAWVAAPEVGPGVFRYGKPLGFKAALLTADGRQIAPIHPRTGGGGVNQRKLTAREVLAWPEDHRITNDIYIPRYVEQGIAFWETLGAVSYLEENEKAADGQTLYLRFAGGASPTGYEIEAYPDGTALTIDNAGYLAIADCAISGGVSGVKITGEQAQYNELRNCEIYFGTDRVLLTGGASHNVVRDCRVEMRFFGTQPGAWAGAEALEDPAARKAAAARCFIYRFYKGWASAHNISNDRSITLKETRDNLIWNNELNGGLIGISIVDTSDILIQGNRVLHHSSVGTAIRANATRIQYDRNHFEDNSINFRLHALNEDTNRIVRLTNNESLLPEKLGNHVFCHVYLEHDVIRAETSPDVYILNNTFRGGDNGLRLPHPGNVETGLPKFVVVGNLFAVGGSAVSGRTLRDRDDALGAFDYNLIIQSPEQEVPAASWFGRHNVVAQDAAQKPTAPDLRGTFEINGKTFEPVPLMGEGSAAR
ncbi:MAG TPA: hypothetical protein VNQ90_14870 [Chthoniobacteraceae bacterium]|nr:hypothetical protein [Chthoniobacteraceae bacterium]